MTTTPSKSRPNPRAEARRAAERRRRLWLIAGGALVLVLAVIIAVLSTGEADSRVTVEDVARDVEVTGDPLPQLQPDSGTDPTLGTAAPTVEGTDFDGEPVSIGGGQGPQLITFLASWCPACGEELPELTEWLEQGNLPEGMDLTAVATFLDASRPNWPPQDWFESAGYPGDVLVDDAVSTASQTFGLSGTPFWVAIDAEGKVVHRSSGLLSASELDSLAAELAAG